MQFYDQGQPAFAIRTDEGTKVSAVKKELCCGPDDRPGAK